MQSGCLVVNHVKVRQINKSSRQVLAVQSIMVSIFNNGVGLTAVTVLASR